MQRATMWTAGLVVATALTGCGNACQALCETMAEYGDECGAPWTQGDIDACIVAQASATAEDVRTCRDFGTPDRLRREWSCDDVLLYRGGDVPSGGGSDTDG